MAKLQKDILSEEERLSGFDVGEPDDDTFALGSSDYFEDIEEIFDVPKEPEQIPDIEPEPDYKVLKNVVDQSDKPEVPVSEVPEEASVPTPPEEEVLVMDNDFKDFVKDLLDKDKVQTVKPSLPVDDTPIIDNYDHEKELTGAEKIYLDDIAPDSKDAETDDSNSTVAAVPLIVGIPQSDEAKEDAKKDEEEEEKRRAFPILLIAGIVAALLLISLTVIYFVYLPLSDEKSELAADSVKTIQESVPAQVEKEAEPIAEIVIDSVEIVVEPEPEPETIAEVMVEKKLDVPPSKTAAPVKPIQQPKAKTTAEVPKPKVQTDKVITDKTPAAKTEIPKVKEAPKKEEDIVSIIPERKTETKKPFVRDNVKEEFTVQIYASPSKEDANRWLEKLRAKSVNDAFISEQMVRDVKWYRVRFGTYDTREEARAAALRYGFAQTWIDRVK